MPQAKKLRAATPSFSSRPYPGAELVPDGKGYGAMAVTIGAPPDQVWATRPATGRSRHGAGQGHSQRGRTLPPAAARAGPIKYPRASWDDQLACWVSDAAVAEVTYTAFTSTDEPITARLIVRRVKDLTRAPEGQGELFPAWRYHAVFTDSPFVLLQAEEHHRDHAQAGQVFADLADGPLAHLPSGSFPANAAWLACTAISHNLLRAAGSLASLACAKARGATPRRGLIDVAARIARHGHGHITLHLPDGWHREQDWISLFEAACGPPTAPP